MIKVICPGTRAQAREIVSLAFARSCSSAQVVSASINALIQANSQTGLPSSPVCWVFLDPMEAWSEHIIAAMARKHTKVVLFGVLPAKLALHLGAAVAPVTPALISAATCAPAPAYQFSQSAAKVRYVAPLGAKISPVPERALLRFDFTDEWNNLGFGAIPVNEGTPSIWALAQSATIAQGHLLARVEVSGQSATAYAAAWDYAHSSVLWFNRSVGPVDSQEWSLVEHFVASYRASELPCWPVLREVPYGYAAAVTMRLDCDEDVESARPLWEAYRAMDVPFSLALHAKVLADVVHHSLPKEVLANGGALLSHTATHAPDWGGSYEAALWEGVSSAECIAQATGYQVRYAVSPFHQTPDYARAALADAGYAGCIGGIIRNDPDFLTARSGQVSAAGAGFIGHSQQHMLHGDCGLADSDAHAIFKQAFDIAKASGALFGYLDHPFSPRYQYGWQTEAQRVQYHQDFVAYMRQTPGVLFCNETDAMDFLSYRAAVQVTATGSRFSVTGPESTLPWNLALEFRGEVFCLASGGLQL
jgi:hypothetical protein